MRYAEIIEAVGKLRAQSADIEKRKRARVQIAAADRKRADAARRYRNDVERAHDTVRKAKAELSRSHAAEGFGGAVDDVALCEHPVRHLRDRNGVLLGTLHPVGRILQAKDRHGSIVGWYDPRTDETRDKRGSIVGSGDLLASLLLCPR